MYEGMISDLLSGVLQTHQVLLEKAQSCYLGKRMLQKKKVWKVIINCGQCVLEKNIYFIKRFPQPIYILIQ